MPLPQQQQARDAFISGGVVMDKSMGHGALWINAKANCCYYISWAGVRSRYSYVLVLEMVGMVIARDRLCWIYRASGDG